MLSALVRAVRKMSILFILLPLVALSNHTLAQDSANSKRRLPKQPLISEQALIGTMAPRPTASNTVLPPNTSDTWTGGAGDGLWGTAGNWSAGVPNGSTIDVTIGLATAAVTENISPSIGNLTLSKSGDSLTIANNTSLSIFGSSINNAGTITLGSSLNNTFLSIDAPTVTLTGGGNVVLGSGGPNFINGNAVTNTLVNQNNTISGAGSVGNGQILLSNAGTFNANLSGQTLTLNPSGASTNTGTLEATGGGSLQLSGASWTNTGGTINAQNASTVTLSGTTITGGILTTSGSGAMVAVNSTLSGLTNSGNLQIQNNSTTTLVGTITNNGTITLGSTLNNTALSVAGGSVTLQGTGSLVLGNGGPNFVDGSSGGTFTNKETITGSGTIGNGQISLVNNKTINANVSGGTLTINPTAGTNTSLLEATGGGSLVLSGAAWTNTGGTITANASTVTLNGTTINGGTLATSNGGSIVSVNSTLNGLTNSGNLQIQNNTTTTLGGTITNNGTITVGSTLNNTAISVGSGSATLAGTGTLVMSTGGPNFIVGSGGTFTNQETITGVGNIGNGQIALVNNGTMNANISPTVSGAALLLSPNGGGLTNTSTLEATNGGTLQFGAGTYTNTGAGAVIEALGDDGHGHASTVALTGGASIVGGTLTTSGAGVILGESDTLTNITNSGNFQVVNNTTTSLVGTITNNGTMTLTSSGNNTFLGIGSGNVTLQGAGTVVLGSGGPNFINGSGGTLTNKETITGAGTIGNGQILLANNATINANLNGTTLTLNPSGLSTNTSLMESSNGGTLQLSGVSWNNTGTIEAQTGSSVVLNGTTITGGTLTTAGTGVMTTVNSTLSGLTNSGNLQVANNTTTTLVGTITNNGTITLGSTLNNTFLNVGTGTVTLNGTGTLVMTSGGPNFINGSGGTFINKETITGAGTIGNGQISFVNNHVINANLSGKTLNLSPGGSGATNTSILEATSGGNLSLSGSTFTNTGTIEALTGSTVSLNGTTINGGTLTTQGSGVINSVNSALANLTNAGNLQIVNNTNTSFTGTITNNGTITLGSTLNNTFLSINGAVTLKGTGTLTLTNGGPNFIVGTGTTPVLTNQSTIQGAGNIGNGSMGFTNLGTLNANLSGGTLAINVNGSGFTNYNGTTDTLTGGTYIANVGNISFAAGNTTGITTLAAHVTEEGGGQIINTTNGSNALAGLTSIASTGSFAIGGLPAFVDAGSFSNAGSLTIFGGQSFTVGSLAQISGSTLTAGTYVLDANLNLSGATQNITTNAANVTLGGGTIKNANSSNALHALATNSGALTLANHSTFTTVGNFSNSGSLTINNGSAFTVNGTLAQITGGTLTAGTYALGGNLTVASGASITTNSAALTLEGGTIMSGATNALAGLNKNTRSLTLAGNANFTTAGNFTNSGTLAVNSGSTFGVTGTLTNLSVGTLTGGTYTIGGTMQLASGNGGIATNAASLTLTGASAKILDGAGNALSTFNNNSGTFTLAGSANLTTATTGSFTNSGTVVVSRGSTFTVGGTGNSYNQSAGTTTVDGTLVGGGTTGVNVTGGTIQGIGTLKTNTSIGSATIHVGDAGKAGLLSITGTYTQLSTGTMNVSIGGLAAGTQFSQLKVTGAASLGGTLTAGLVNGFTPAVGQTFTVLTAASITGTFANSTIAINGSEHFAVSYTATGVVLTVTSGAASKASATTQVAVAKPAQNFHLAKLPVAVSGLRHKTGVLVKLARPVFVAGRTAGEHSNLMAGRPWEAESLRMPRVASAGSAWNRMAERQTQVSRIPADNSIRPVLRVPNVFVGGNGMRVSPVSGGRMGLSTQRPAMPARTLPTHIPMMAVVR